MGFTSNITYATGNKHCFSWHLCTEFLRRVTEHYEQEKSLKSSFFFQRKNLNVLRL